MAEGQRKKTVEDEDRGIRLLNKNVEKTNRANTERTEAEKLAARTPAELDVELDEAFTQMDADEQKKKDRIGIASGLKDLSKRGALTGDLLKEARQRATAAGVSDDQFSSFMDKEGIKTQDFATAAPTESKEEAAQNVMFQRQYGTGLGTLAAMQDPNYELGSGSAPRQPPREIGPKSGKARRSSRRLLRQGYGAAAQQMAMAGEMARMNEPSIDTPALRGQRMLQKMAAGKEARKQDKIAAGSKDMFDAMGMEKPKSNASIQQPKKVGEYQSPLDKTRNEGGFGAIKRQGQRI